ncbi:MAG: DNA recombination protein RmuC [Parabacteroides sp.]|uniref:DNA recombination protein RmuC n=1 Tax=Parabacteroides faecalis TaxID=2924040 RepID=A0ABT0C0M0_9BACT|nr:DNA recombination protein RmuC [Parabacteroides faecalis]MCI7286195.1 DNA recombination protein RmuC [Parabacteroides sp.]MDY6255434.1 DNA recombination protein RmuC [Bacteroidales bacterium]MCJ2380176.1 DNA recombination protein RmuC [Parabacteroides faecalis]MDD6951221.1 DNA recombination protein RmuC [Parabacteroides sp.]MDD7560795.1 DNA recombination protein RmuC [Parabacteroides sp.]
MDWIILILLFLVLLFQFFIWKRISEKESVNQTDLLRRDIQQGFERIEKNFREDFKLNREESRMVAKENRAELANSMNEFRAAFDRGIASFNALQREKFASLNEQQQLLVNHTEKRLEEIRITVEEKLQKTLNERISQSFRLVNEQLENVQKGLGEMQTLAQDVGGLKRVLSNVKTRGNIGEIQLSMLLEQLLAPEQYEANVKTKKGSDALVEFAVKLPGKDDLAQCVYLPIDAKFPKDMYEQLLDAYDTADPQQIETAGKNLETTIRKMAKDISDKYLDPPATTEFGIMFLPFEGIYAEVVRRSALLEDLQRNYRVVVTGPTTLAAILNSLQMGFRTLAIQKYSGEVWKILGAVKKEFESMGGMLEKAKKHLETANGQIDNVLGVRTRAIQRRLKDVDTLSAEDARKIIPEIGPLEEDEKE